MTDLLPCFPALSPEDALRAQEALLTLLARQARLYAPGSSSLPTETAAALADSLLLTLGADRDPSVLLTADLPERLRQGQRRSRQKAAVAHRLCQTVSRALPLENRALADTLRSLSHFQARYDWRFFAQDIPCDIDYQLSQPVPDTLRGADYVLEWLRRLGMETDILSRFDPSRARAVLEVSCPDWQGLLIDLYEPVAINALGLALLGEAPRTLSVSPPQCRRLEALFMRHSPAETLENGAAALCAALNVTSRQTGHYLQDTARALGPRLQAALSAGTLEHIFSEA